jgi:hypothetical protein
MHPTCLVVVAPCRWRVVSGLFNASQAPAGYRSESHALLVSRLLIYGISVD